MTVYRSANASSATGTPGPSVFRILHVCLANQCRSPMAERLTRHELAVQAPRHPESWDVASAGTGASDGAGMHPAAALALTAAGIDAGDFVARQLTRSMIDNTDLVLAATAAERDLVLAQVPSALPIAFTLREFARLAAAVAAPDPLVCADAAAQARAVLADARAARGRVPFVEPDHDDIPDPAGTPAAFDHCLTDIATAVRAVVAALTGAQVPAGR